MALIDSLISYWKLDDNAANTDVDDAVETNDGTLAGGDNTDDLSVAGKITTALDFDGTNDYVNVGTMGTLGSNLDNGVSISFWIKTTEAAAAYVTGVGNDGDNTLWDATLNLNSAGAFDQGKLFTVLRDEDDNELKGATTNDEVWRDGAWHHICITADGNNNLITIYVDGDSKAVSYSVQTTPDNFANFAYANVFPARNFRGAITSSTDAIIDEFGIWNKILTSGEVTSLWNGGDGLTHPFVQDKTVLPTALALSTTAVEPTILIKVTTLVLSAGLSLGTPFIILPNPNKGTKSTKEIDKNYDANLAQGRQINLVAEGLNGIKSTVFKKEKEGL